MNQIELSDVDVRFGPVTALRDVSVALGRGEILMLVGPNGAGKTTLARVLLGLVRPQRGRLAIDGEGQSSPHQLKKQLGYLPEAVAFSENLSGRQVLRFFAWSRGVSTRRVDVALDRVGLGHAARRSVRGYSRGMRQRLGLAVAILHDPELLVLDEPTGGLDNEGLAVLWSILAEWRQRERMVLLTSHQLSLLERRVDRVCVFRKGKIIASGSPEQLRDRARLRDRVVMGLAGDADRFCDEVAALPGAEVDREADQLVVELDRGQLLALMDIRGDHRGAVTSLRIEEPTLDMVYESLLAREAA